MARILIFCALCLLSLTHQATAQNATVTLSGVLNETSSQKIEINFTLTNTSSDALEIYIADLPWSGRYSLMLVAVTNDLRQRPLGNDVYPIEDPGPEFLTLKPHDQLSGSVDLIRRFPTLPKVLKEHEVIVFWSYKARLPNGSRLEQLSGAVVLKNVVAVSTGRTDQAARSTQMHVMVRTQR